MLDRTGGLTSGTFRLLYWIELNIISLSQDSKESCPPTRHKSALNTSKYRCYCVRLQRESVAMPTPDLLSICITAFASVFLLLAVLALVMRLILIVFPSKTGVTDTVVIASVASVLQTLYPGTRITKVEEIK